MNLKKRLRSKSLWVSVASLVGIILQELGVFTLPTETWDTGVTAILGGLALLGLLNDPTTECTGYADDKWWYK
jgi:uncharacterized membrane protein